MDAAYNAVRDEVTDAVEAGNEMIAPTEEWDGIGQPDSPGLKRGLYIFHYFDKNPDGSLRQRCY
jgi:hypothetical protein